jgi:hypothetical protein
MQTCVGRCGMGLIEGDERIKIPRDTT